MGDNKSRIAGLDGIRAIACLVVIAFHCQVPGFGGGWLGVDVFFVLSGYLITGILLAERQLHGRIRLRSFYLRRAARLYPALLLTVALGAAVMMATPPSPWVLVVVAYLVDVWMMTGRSVGLYGHTWSLAIEEQFYLVWPLLVVALRSRRALGLVAIAGLVASFVAMTSAGWHMPAEVYFGPHARAWELLAGAALAIIWPNGARQGRVSVALGAGGVALIVSALVVGRGQDFPYVWPVAGAAATGTVAVLAGIRDPRCHVILESRWLCWIGARSYGLYLFHHPLASAWETHAGGMPWVAGFAVVLAASLVLAALSMRFLEAPIRDWVRLRTGPRTRGRSHEGSLHDRDRVDLGDNFDRQRI